MNLANSQGRRVRETYLEIQRGDRQSSWLTPGGDRKARGGALSRGFIGS